VSKGPDTSDYTFVRNEVDACTVRYDVEIPAHHVKQGIERALRDYRQRARIPGFRLGKAPMELVRRRFSSEILQGVKDRMVRSAVLAAAERESKESGRNVESGRLLNPEAVTVQDDEPFVCAVELELSPEFELPDYRNFDIPWEAPEEVTDEEVEEALQRWQERFAVYEESDQPAEMDDHVLIEAHGRLLGEEEPTDDMPATVRAILEIEEQWLPLIEPSFLPGAPAQLVGSRAGDERTIQVDFPEEGYILPDLAGKSAEYVVRVKKVRKRALPELDDEFAKRAGFDTVDDIRERERERLSFGNTVQWVARIRAAVTEGLLADANFPVPKSRLDQEIRRSLRALVQEEMEKGHQPETLRERAQEIQEEAERRALRTLRLQYILRSIAEKENIEISEDEVEREIHFLARRLKMSPKTARKRLYDSGGIEDLYDSLLEEKALDFVCALYQEKYLSESDAEQEASEATEDAPAAGDSQQDETPEAAGDPAADSGGNGDDAADASQPTHHTE